MSLAVFPMTTVTARRKSAEAATKPRKRSRKPDAAAKGLCSADTPFAPAVAPATKGIATVDTLALPAPVAANAAELDRLRAYRRAPRGGVVLAGKFYRGGCFVPAARPAAGHALAVDVTRDNFAVAITNPATGNTRRFRVATILDGKWAGSRVAMVADDAARDWRWIGWADEFGVRSLARLATDPAVAGPNGYVALLNESARFAARGIVYNFTTN